MSELQKESDLSLVGRVSTHVESFSCFFKLEEVKILH